MNVSSVRTAIAAVLSGLSYNSTSLNVYAHADDSPTVPAAVVFPQPGTFLVWDTMRSAPDNLTLVIDLLVSRGSDVTGQATLDGWIDTVASAFDTSNLSGTVSYARVTEGRNYGNVQYGEVIYYGCQLVVEVAA